MRLHDHLAFRARIQPDAEFACFGARRLDYRSADAESSRIANALVAAGLGIGDRVAVLATNCLEFALFYYAASKAGVVPVPLNYRLAPAEWAWILNDSGARLLVARGGLVEALDRVRNELTSIGTFVALEAERPGWQSWADFLDGHAGTPPARSM